MARLTELWDGPTGQKPMSLRRGWQPGGPGPYLLVEQHLCQVCHLILPRYHSVIRGHGQAAALSLSHGLPGAIQAQQLKVLQLQVLGPRFSALPWGEKEGGISHSCPAQSKGPSGWVWPRSGLPKCTPRGRKDVERGGSFAMHEPHRCQPRPAWCIHTARGTSAIKRSEAIKTCKDMDRSGKHDAA